MHLVNQNNKALGLLMTVALITGCASSQKKLEAFNRIKIDTRFVYAQVNKISSGSTLKEECKHLDKPPELKAFRMKVCPQMNAFNVVNWSLLLKDKLIFNRTEVVPVTVKLKVGSIVKLDENAEAGFRFVEVAAYEETETCKWTGSDNDLADNKATATGRFMGWFFAGAFMTVPAVGYQLVSDQQGGIECDKWSYKTAYADFLK